MPGRLRAAGCPGSGRIEGRDGQLMGPALKQRGSLEDSRHRLRVARGLALDAYARMRRMVDLAAISVGLLAYCWPGGRGREAPPSPDGSICCPGRGGRARRADRRGVGDPGRPDLMRAVGVPLVPAARPIVSFANTVNNLTPASTGEVLRRSSSSAATKSKSVCETLNGGDPRRAFWAILIMLATALAASIGTIARRRRPGRRCVESRPPPDRPCHRRLRRGIRPGRLAERMLPRQPAGPARPWPRASPRSTTC